MPNFLPFLWNVIQRPKGKKKYCQQFYRISQITLILFVLFVYTNNPLNIYKQIKNNQKASIWKCKKQNPLRRICYFVVLCDEHWISKISPPYIFHISVFDHACRFQQKYKWNTSIKFIIHAKFQWNVCRLSNKNSSFAKY